MFIVYYEEYGSDGYREKKKIECYSMQTIVSWFFGLCWGDYRMHICVPDPDNKIYESGPSGMQCHCEETEGVTYIVHMIVSEKTGIESRFRQGIIYSDGVFTSGKKHWCEEMKDVCREMNKQIKDPVFDFV